MRTYKKTPRPAPCRPVEYDFDCPAPSQLLDRLRDLRRIRTDAALSRLLGIKPPTLSKIRTGKAKITAAVVLRIHEVYGLPVSDLRTMLAQPEIDANTSRVTPSAAP